MKKGTVQIIASLVAGICVLGILAYMMLSTTSDSQLSAIERPFVGEETRAVNDLKGIVAAYRKNQRDDFDASAATVDVVKTISVVNKFTGTVSYLFDFKYRLTCHFVFSDGRWHMQNMETNLEPLADESSTRKLEPSKIERDWQEATDIFYHPK